MVNNDQTVDLGKLRVAIVHHWFMQRRGGEQVVEVMAELFPEADIYTLLYNQEALGPALRGHAIHASFLQRLPGSRRWHRFLLPLYPFALEQFDLDKYDLVISSESGPAKGVLTSQRTCHICYCNTPMRYLWDMYHSYWGRKSAGSLLRVIFALTAHYVRLWDLATAARVDYFLANSGNVAARIRKHYRREATVMHCPVNVSAGYLSPAIEDYYLVVSPLVDYKRIDLAIEACNRLGRPLRIIGGGEEDKNLRRLAGPTVRFLGFLPDEEVRENYAHCRALLYPGEEDFGLVPVEAQSFGRPVIAYGRGGALETVAGFFAGDVPAPESSSGIFFAEQSVESLVAAIQVFESVESRFSPALTRAHAESFDTPRFQAKLRAFIAEKVSEFRGRQAAEPARLPAGVPRGCGTE